MRYRRLPSVTALALLTALAAGRLSAVAEDWPPITEADRAMKDCPQQPGAPAVYLWREEKRDPDRGTTTYFRRLKILTPAGRERANIEIPVIAGVTKLRDLKARVVQPDGTIRPFTGRVIDKATGRVGRFRMTVKAFALPDVDVGSIIDYGYKTVPYLKKPSKSEAVALLEKVEENSNKPYEGGVYADLPAFSRAAGKWDIQKDLFTCRAKFSYKPSFNVPYIYGLVGLKMRLNWVSHRLPGALPAMKDGWVELALQNIPAFEVEEWMTPESTERMEVRFFYMDGRFASPDEYWEHEARNWQKGVEQSIGKSEAISRESLELTGRAADPLEKLKILYQRARRIKNLSYDKVMAGEGGDEPEARGGRKSDDVLEHNEGWRSDITRAFVALARGAGFEAKVVRAAARDDKAFDKTLCGLYGQFDRELAVVNLGGRDEFFDPATPFCPMGLISWDCSDTTCLSPSDSPPLFLRTPVYPPDAAVTRREIALRLGLEGSLAGTVKIGYSGQEALVRRLKHIGDDQAKIERDLEAELADLLPPEATVSLKKVENMDNDADVLWAEFDVSIPAIAVAADGRALLPVSPLLGEGRHPFRRSRRQHPICFPYPCRESDEIVVTLAPGMKIETAPAPVRRRQEGFDYFLSASPGGNGSEIRVRRAFAISKSYFPVAKYPAIQAFFDQVRAADEEQIVLAMEKK